MVWRYPTPHEVLFSLIAVATVVVTGHLLPVGSIGEMIAQVFLGLGGMLGIRIAAGYQPPHVKEVLAAHDLDVKKALAQSTESPTIPAPPAVIALVIASLAFSGCATALDGATKAKGIAAQSISATAVTFLEFDRKEQTRILETAQNAGEYRAASTNYRTRVQVPAIRALKAADGALGTLDAAIAAYKAGKLKDIGGAVQALVAAAIEVKTTLAALGVPLGGL